MRRHLSAQRGYASLINTSGRQRMLSQRLVKTVLELRLPPGDTPKAKIIDELDETLHSWREVDYLLAHGELSQANRSELLAVHPILQRMYSAGVRISMAYRGGWNPAIANVNPLVQQILVDEQKFLPLMDHLVGEYEKDAEAQLANSEWIQNLTNGAALVMILFLCWFGFRPVLIRNAHLLEEAVRQRERALAVLAKLAIENEERIRVAHALQESEAKMRALLDAIPDAVSCYDREFRYLYVNPAMAQLRGFPPEAFTGWTDRNLGVPKDLCETWELDLRRAWETKLPQVTHFDFPSPNGTLTCMARTVPRLRPDGSVLDLAVVTTDLTRMRQAEADLKVQKHFLEQLILTIPELIYVEDLKTGNISYANGNLFKLLGHVVDDVNSWNAGKLEFVHPDDRALRSRLRESLVAAADGEVLRADYRCRHADGSWRWLSTWVTVFARSQDGTPTEIIGSAHDITDRVAAEERFRVLFERSSDAHLLLGPDGIIDCNEAAVRMLGCRDKIELLSAHPASFSPERQPDGRLSAEKAAEMDVIAHHNGHHRFDWMHRRADGTPFPFEVTLTPVHLAGKPVLLSVLHDLTERKRAEKELFESKRFIDKIAATVPSGIFVHDNVANRNVFCNEANAAMFGYSLTEFSALPDPAIAIVHPDDREELAAGMTALQRLADNETVELEFRALHRHGQARWVGCRLTVFARDAQGRVTQVLGVNQDVTARRKADDALTFQAMNDALTGLPNRRAFFERLSRDLKPLPSAVEIPASPLTICICDIDGFKQVNDGHGHQAGDRVLVAFSKVLQAEVRQTDFSARLGGDEFCICLPGAAIGDASTCIERIRRKIETIAFGSKGSSFSVTVSFGLAQWDGCSDMDGLMEIADNALYTAKRQGRNCLGQIHLVEPVGQIAQA